MKKKIIFAISLVVLVSLLATLFYEMKNANSSVAKQLGERMTVVSDPKTLEYLNKNHHGDITLGNPDSRINVVEYGSLTCHHCADFFKDNFEKLKQEYITNGKVKFIHRAVVSDWVAMRATCVIESANLDADRSIKLVDGLYRTQEFWIKNDVKTSIEAMEKIILEFGVTKDLIAKCASDKKLTDKIAKEQTETFEMLNISSTPTIFVGNKKIKGYLKYDTLKALIEEELKR